MARSESELKAILAQVLEKTEAAERAEYLAKICGDDYALREQIDAMLAEHARGEETTEPATPDGLGAGPANGPESDTETADLSSDRANQQVAKRVPAQKPAETEPEPKGGGPGTTVRDWGGPTEAIASRIQPGASRDATHPDDPNATAAEGFIGRVIAGRYKLVEVLGEGGMGTVYRAEQTQPVRRPVALKLIREGMSSRVVIARFDAERQALALMEHPNIARVFDGGATENGQPFFVMEYVEGEPITRYCDRRRLHVSARLELFVAVCQAVQHAHQKGIIHRDLKPGNVLVTEVDGRPAPKVIDFGVAKALERDLTEWTLNDTGAIVGTPTYMSPEQADPTSMDVDTRTDVYALGVILYELLVGSPPIDARQFRRGAVLEMLRMVREVDPPRPSTRLSTAEDLPNIAANRSIEPARLTKSLRGELDWVVMKALEKDRDRRYDSANGLARDLQRYLADEVVEARPPSTGYRLRKFVRRYRVQVIAASLILIALVAGVAGTTIGLVQAEEQRGIAERRAGQLTLANEATTKEKVRAETEADRARQNFDTARALILDLGKRINQLENGENDPRLVDRARKAALDKAREQFEQFLVERPDDESMQWQAALLHRYAANVDRLLIDFRAADSAYAASVKILENLASRYPEKSVYRNELALALSDRAMLEKRMGKLKEAATTLDCSIGVLEGTAISGRESTYQRTFTIAVIELDRADVAHRRGQFEDSSKYASRAAEMFESLKAEPAALRIGAEPLYAAIAARRRAVALRELGNAAEAITLNDDSVSRMKALGGPNATRDVIFHDCEVRRERGLTARGIADRRALAVDDLGEVIKIGEKIVNDYPQVGFYREGLAADYLCRAELLILLGRHDDAATDLAKSLLVSRELLNRHGPLSDSLLVRARTYLAFGKARSAAGKNDEALGHWKNAITIFELALKTDPDNVHHQRGLAETRTRVAPPR